MHKNLRARLLAVSAFGILAGVSGTGCQTWMGGMTLPSPHYLDQGHTPQYFPDEPNFPLPRELSYQEEAAGLLNARDQAGARNPAPVPAVGGAAAPGR